MITSFDVARLAGVSQPTVSRAFRDSDKVSEKTKARVRQAAAALGYAPNAIGRALALGHSTRSALWSPICITTSTATSYRTCTGAEPAGLRARPDHRSVRDRAASPSRSSRTGLSGVVLTTTTVDSTLPGRLRDRSLPFVYFNRTAPSVESSSVTVDPESGMTALVSEIVRLGHRHIGAVFGPRTTSTGETRESVLRGLLEEHDVYLRRQDVRHGPFDFDTGFRACLELLDLDDPPTVLICANDVVALGAMNAAAERGVAVPEFISIVGFDDLPTSSWPLVQLTTVAYDLAEMSREAGRLVVDARQLTRRRPSQHVVLPTSLVRRRTLAARRN